MGLLNFWKMNKYKQQIDDAFSLDQGGDQYSSSIVELIMNLRTGLFTYSGWPFKLQTQEEIEIMLFKYGAVAPIKVGDDWIAVPVKLSRVINKINYSHVSVSITGDWKTEIGKAFDLDKKEIKKQNPFLFDVPSQSSALERQAVLFEQLSGTFNANVSNRINKNKQYIIEVENGQVVEKSIVLNYTTKNYSPFTIIEKGKKGDDPMSSDGLRPMTNGVVDLYNSLSTEKKEILKELHVHNGLRSSQTNEKSSAQETDTQTTSQDRDTVNNLLTMFRARQQSIKNMNRYMGTKIEVRFKKNIQVWITETLREDKGDDNNE